MDSMDTFVTSGDPDYDDDASMLSSAMNKSRFLLNEMTSSHLNNTTLTSSLYSKRSSSHVPSKNSLFYL
jgi:hypothetical protein